MSDEIDHIADLEQHLYARDPENIPKRKFGILRPLRQKATSAWGNASTKIDRSISSVKVTGFKRFFIFSVIFFVFALGIALFSFYRGAILLSSKNVDVTILGNSFVAGGEDLPIQIEIVNKNSTDLTDVKLTINYPKGATDETGSDLVRVERDIGIIPSGKTKSEELTVVLYGEQGIIRDIKATLSYSLSGSKSSFEKESIASVMISSSPVKLTIDAPTSVIPNQPFTINIRNNFEGDKPLGSAIVRVEYPNGFIFDKAIPAPVSGNNVWALADLTKGSTTTISISGRLLGEEQDEKSFRIYLGAPENETSSKIAVAYNSALQTILLSRPFIDTNISILEKNDDIIPLAVGTTVTGSVLWANSSQNTIDDPMFILSIRGNSFDKKSIRATKGFYNELDGTIIWSSDSDSDLISLKPGQSGSLPFSFDTISDVQGSRDINISLSVNGKIFETQTDEAISNVDQKVIVFASNVDFSSTAFYSIGPIKNTGPFPPKANMSTTYTITWTVRPVENPLAQLVASATLPIGTSWSGIVMPQTEDITYNPDSRLVTWNINSLPKATSVPKVRTVSFQVNAKPTVFQVGTMVKLLGETIISGLDTTTNTTVGISVPSLDTLITQDPIYATGKESVLP